MTATQAQQANANRSGYTSEQCHSLRDQFRELRSKTPRLQLSLGELATRLTVERARRFASEGLGRRLPLVERAALNIFRIYPPEREKFLGRDELSDVAIQLHAFAINVYAIFDNIAWVCMLEGGGTLPYSKIGLFKSDCKPYLPPGLQAYLEQDLVKNWFDHYGKVYRDSTAHRIPPYLPSRVLTPDEATRYQELHRKSEDALLAAAAIHDSAEVDRLLGEHEDMVDQKEAIGRNSQLIALSLTGEDYKPPVFMHPQLLCDLALVHELMDKFEKSFRISKGWPEPVIPPVNVI